MADVYKQSFKQNYTNNIELSIFNCGIERCAPSKTWGPGIRDHYLIHLVLSGKGEFEVGGRTWQVINHYIVKQLGGTTGDTYGFVVEVTEVLLILVYIITLTLLSSVVKAPIL